MTEDHSFLYAEYAKPVKNEGKNRRMRILLISLYILFSASYALFFSAITFPHAIALLPLFLWMLVFFTWHHVSFEYCVRVQANKITFLKIKDKKEKTIFALEAKELLLACPADKVREERIRAFSVKRVLDFRASKDSENAYLAVADTKDGQILLRFECTVAVANAMHYYNKNVTVDKTYLKY